MRNNILCGSAGAAVVRDVRCWHGGTANTSNQIRPMTSVGYFAPWFRMPGEKWGQLPRKLHESLSERGRQLTKHMVPEA
jgi:hypothetical protein